MTKELTASFQEKIAEWRTEANFNIARELSYWAHAWGCLVREHYPGELTKPVVQNLIDWTGVVAGRNISRATVFLWVGLADINPDWEELVSPLGKHNINIKGIYEHYQKRLPAPKPEKEPETGLCPHECEYHQKLTLPRKSLGGGKI